MWFGYRTYLKWRARSLGFLKLLSHWSHWLACSRRALPASTLSSEASFSWGGGQKGKLFFNTWWLTLHLFAIVQVLNTRQFGSGSRSKEIGNWPKGALPASTLSSEASFSFGGSQREHLLSIPGGQRSSFWYCTSPVLNTRARKLTKGHPSLSPRCPRRPASPSEEARENNYFQYLEWLEGSDPLFWYCTST
jgi:hypothetical protein